MRERRQAESDADIRWAALVAQSDLRDEADEFEDALLADMRRRGAVDVL